MRPEGRDMSETTGTQDVSHINTHRTTKLITLRHIIGT